MATAPRERPAAARRRKLWLTVGAIAIVVLIAMCAGQVYWLVRWEVSHRLAAKLPGPVTFRDISIPEPSGVAYHEQRHSILVVSDNGLMSEFDLDYKKLRSWEIGGDLEGISPSYSDVFYGVGTNFVFDVNSAPNAQSDVLLTVEAVADIGDSASAYIRVGRCSCAGRDSWR